MKEREIVTNLPEKGVKECHVKEREKVKKEGLDWDPCKYVFFLVSSQLNADLRKFEYIILRSDLFQI